MPRVQQAHPQLQALAALDRFNVGRFASLLAPLYQDLSGQCQKAFRDYGSIPAVIRTYDAGILRINEVQDDLIRDGFAVALITVNRAFAKELLQKYGLAIVQTFDLTAGSIPSPSLEAALEDEAKALVPLPPAIATMRLGGGLSDEQVARYMNSRDAWGWTFSERIWKNDAETRRNLTQAIEDHLRSGNGVLNDVSALKQFQVMDPALNRYMADLERKARAAFSGTPAAKAAFLRALDTARREAEGLKGGPLGTKAFTVRTINQLEKAVKSGITQSVDDAITNYVDRRAKYRAAVLLRTEGVRASQFLTWEKYKSQDFVLGIQWNLSLSHRKVDICDLKAEGDVGLGPGIYYKDYIPWPDHPSGICYLTSVLPRPEDLGTAKPYVPSDPDAYRQVVDSMKEGELVRKINALGSRKVVPMDEVKALIRGLPKIPPIQEQEVAAEAVA